MDPRVKPAGDNKAAGRAAGDNEGVACSLLMAEGRLRGRRLITGGRYELTVEWRGLGAEHAGFAEPGDLRVRAAECAQDLAIMLAERGRRAA
jgi:hypothetical protein